MPVIYIPRVFGGTIVLSTGSSSTIPTLLIVATFRDGEQIAQYRDGSQPAQYRDGQVTAGGR